LLLNSTSHGLRVNSADEDGIFVTSAGDYGVRIDSAGEHGVYVGSAGETGVYVGEASDKGVWVYSIGNPSGHLFHEQHNGFTVAGAAGHGLAIGIADLNGVDVWRTGGNGVHLNRPGQHGLFVAEAGSDGVHVHQAQNGLYVNSAQADGLYVNGAGDDGIDVAGNPLAGYFFGHIQVTAGCTGCTQATFALNTSDRDLTPGDIVSLAGLRESSFDSVPVVMDVKAANGADAVVGVVSGWAELVTEEEPRPNEIGQRLVPREGAAKPGQYVTVVYSGLAQVKVSAVDGPIAQGSKLVAGTGGTARAQRAVELEGVKLAESASSIGIALERLEAGDGLVWALVNVQ
jgi:hypothetical protein